MHGSAEFLFPVGRISPESVIPPSTTNAGMGLDATKFGVNGGSRRNAAEVRPARVEVQPLPPSSGYGTFHSLPVILKP